MQKKFNLLLLTLLLMANISHGNATVGASFNPEGALTCFVQDMGHEFTFILRPLDEDEQRDLVFTTPIEHDFGPVCVQDRNVSIECKWKSNIRKHTLTIDLTNVQGQSNLDTPPFSTVRGTSQRSFYFLKGFKYKVNCRQDIES